MDRVSVGLTPASANAMVRVPPAVTPRSARVMVPAAPPVPAAFERPRTRVSPLLMPRFVRVVAPVIVPEVAVMVMVPLADTPRSSSDVELATVFTVAFDPNSVDCKSPPSFAKTAPTAALDSSRNLPFLTDAVMLPLAALMASRTSNAVSTVAL